MGSAEGSKQHRRCEICGHRVEVPSGDEPYCQHCRQVVEHQRQMAEVSLSRYRNSGRPGTAGTWDEGVRND